MVANTTGSIRGARTAPTAQGRPGDTFGAAQFDRAGAPLAPAQPPQPHPIPVAKPAPIDTSFHPQALDGLKAGLRLIGAITPHIVNARSTGEAQDALVALSIAAGQVQMIALAIRSNDNHAPSRVNGAVGQISAAAAAWAARSIK